MILMTVLASNFPARFKMLGHFQIFVSALVFGVNIRFGIYDVPPTVFVY